MMCDQSDQDLNSNKCYLSSVFSHFLFRERGVLMKYGDADNNEYVQMVHAKLELAKTKLIKMVNDYC